jgi:hypothetical protein
MADEADSTIPYHISRMFEEVNARLDTLEAAGEGADATSTDTDTTDTAKKASSATKKATSTTSSSSSTAAPFMEEETS